ncbi:hypothetical protein [Leptothoe kymatousa]|uniref:Ribbon-helix-helix protein CopG domain-containing protein n=1 Tax=Leptothoe kymatousa TAU-MAC 1615 TaxID=2364775 RepID=A0ABS5Y425_9CYAN|nr:hypothetical protein [Leptothoe kymatousa]MBT9312562.1 hypothetical protein [Leptothoe kymatousa TAU-MAC 1615]
MYAKARGTAERASRVRTLTVEFPKEVRINITKASADLEISCGQLVRDAVGSYLEQIEAQKQNLTAA